MRKPSGESERAGIPSLLWPFVGLGLFVVYAMNPLWPASVAPFAWRWYAAPAFLAVTGALCFYASRNRRLTTVAIGAVLLLLYFFVEGCLGTLIYYYCASGKIETLEVYLYLGLLNLLSQLSVTAIFAAFGTITWLIREAIWVRRQYGSTTGKVLER
jgi:hypothetical protein